jgi:hypothetical protein
MEVVVGLGIFSVSGAGDACLNLRGGRSPVRRPRMATAA